VIDINQDKFYVIPQQSDVQVFPDPDNSGRDEYVSKLVIGEATEADGGLYICFVKNPVGYKFKNAYLTVEPSKCLECLSLEANRGPFLTSPLGVKLVLRDEICVP
jgi:hypothetical protein